MLSPAGRLPLFALQQIPKTWVGMLALLLTNIAIIAYIYYERTLVSSSSSYVASEFVASSLSSTQEPAFTADVYNFTDN